MQGNDLTLVLCACLNAAIRIVRSWDEDAYREDLAHWAEVVKSAMASIHQAQGV